MLTKARPSVLARSSVAGIVGAFCACSAPLWPSRAHQHPWPFSLSDLEGNPRIGELLTKIRLKWGTIPSARQEEIGLRNLDLVANGFLLFTAPDLTKVHAWNWAWVEVRRACRHALGNDVVVELIGSVKKQTCGTRTSLLLPKFGASVSDLDIQVRRRPGSSQADTLFTETDKLKVAANLEKCEGVTGPVIIGRIAIKFAIDDLFSVDLVLANPRPEEFPRLRGGEDFYENSLRINEFLKKTPAARHAIVGVKKCFTKATRPKGILLEAIVWRLSQTYPFPLAEESFLLESGEKQKQQIPIETFLFFSYVLFELKNWEESSFGRDLKQDLDKLPERERHKFAPGIQHLLEGQCVDFIPCCLCLGIFLTEETESRQGEPFHLYLERLFREFLPFDF